MKMQSRFTFVDATPACDKAHVDSRKKLIRSQAASQQPTPANHGIYACNGEMVLPRSAAQWNRYQARKRRRSLIKIKLSIEGLPGLGTTSPTEDDELVPSVDASSSGPRSQGEESVGEVPSNSVPSSSSVGTSLSLTPPMAGAGWGFPFVPYSGSGPALVPLLIGHYLSNLATDIPELDAGIPGLLRSRWFPMVITESALLNVVLLTAASHYASNRSMPRAKHCLYSLKHEAIAATNKLLVQNVGTINDQVIGAVAKLASYEAMFGEREQYHTHMRALVRMVEMRGGLLALGLDGLLMRMVLWIDLNSAFLLGCRVYFKATIPLAGHVAILEPCPGHFLGAR